MATPKGVVSFRAAPDQHKKMREEAKKLKIEPSEFVRRAIEEKLASSPAASPNYLRGGEALESFSEWYNTLRHEILRCPKCRKLVE